MNAAVTLQVESSCGVRSLCECFVPSQGLAPEFQVLLTQLQLPILSLPVGPDWAFLQQLGVSTELNWPTLCKWLQQLSSRSTVAEGQLAGSDSDLAAMLSLYKQVFALVMQSQQTAAEVRECFEHYPVVFVRTTAAEDAAGEAGTQGFWVTCRDVMWSGSRRVFPHKTFIKSFYKVSCCAGQCTVC